MKTPIFLTLTAHNCGWFVGEVGMRSTFSLWAELCLIPLSDGKN